jgi:hypothetical protein
MYHILNMLSSKHVSKSKYLISTCWEKITDQGYTIAGTVQHDIYVETEEEAKREVELLKERAEEFNKEFPSLCRNRTSRYVYILNRPEWWLSITEN